MKKLIKFIEKAKGLDTKEKIKLLLFLNKNKSNAEVILKICAKNLGEKFEFENLLKQQGIFSLINAPKSYEEIKKIKKNKIIWEIEGTYHTYDLFKTKKDEKVFQEYLDLIKKNKYKQVDKLLGKHYHYPPCCIIKFIKEKNEKFLQKNYSYYQYYKKQEQIDQKFPFIFHQPCSLKCKPTINLNKNNLENLRKMSKKIYNEYKNKSKFKGNLIVGNISDIEIKGKSIWKKKTAYEYELIFKKPFRKQYYLVNYLSKKKYEKGQVLKGEVLLKYDYAQVKIIKEKNKIINNLYHQRKLPLLGEVVIK